LMGRIYGVPHSSSHSSVRCVPSYLWLAGVGHPFTPFLRGVLPSKLRVLDFHSVSVCVSLVVPSLSSFRSKDPRHILEPSLLQIPPPMYCSLLLFRPPVPRLRPTPLESASPISSHFLLTRSFPPQFQLPVYFSPTAESWSCPVTGHRLQTLT